MAIKKNMIQWNIDHGIKNKENLLFFKNRSTLMDKPNFYSRWLFIRRDPEELICDIKNMCQRSRNIYDQNKNKIKTVFIPDNINEIIDYRLSVSLPDHYWYHEKCRCKSCDYVRICGYKNLTDKEKIQFKDINWDDRWSEQWKNKIF